MIFINENIKQEFESIITYTDNLYMQRKEKIDTCNNETELKNICKTPVDTELRHFVWNNISRKIPLKYSYCGVRFENIYIKKPNKLMNGSNTKTFNTIKNALKYQMIANYDIFSDVESLDENKIKEITYIAKLYCYKLMYNINNSITFNQYGTINYNPIDSKKIDELIKEVRIELVNNNYTVYDLGDVPHVLQKKYTYNNMELMSKEELICYINEVGVKPTIKEVASYINTNNKLPHDKDLSNETLKYYIDKYGLRDMVSIKSRRTKAEMKHRKEILPSNICHDILNH